MNRQKVNAPSRSFALQGPCDPHRVITEQYIARQYHRVYEANIQAFLPLLLTMSAPRSEAEAAPEASDHQLLAAAGLRPASAPRLFLESYLELPVEQAIAQAARIPVSRNSVIEIGNLVSTQRGGSLQLFLVMAAALQQAGFSWLVFTATPQVEKLVKRLHAQPMFLAPADACKVAGSAGEWGRYYQHCPRVMVVDLNHSMTLARQNLMIDKVFSEHQLAIRALGQHIGQFCQQGGQTTGAATATAASQRSRNA
ncbi:hypothetical protein G8770_05455 [Aestuariicella hydrocarbonica]|uniref:Thermostable hemolysin n=1 Tax=Pseudomaricurvus hydrocarbonicus TaxID=1470433 RepID=A0A9E5MGQ1_9GAMM|nr:thermostable hemolysin [Aestuariicella hydrocarbonica]NHO64986.1 hypothetical protein [Aestuariicella hydrocarbonica]